MRNVTRFAWTLILSALLFTTGAQAQTTLLTESFDGGVMPAGWTQTIVTGSTNWLFNAVGNNGTTPATTHSGAYNALLKFSGYGQKNDLVTPAINFTGYPIGSITFWHVQGNWGGDQDSLTVFYRTSATDTWKKIGQYTSNITSWTQESINLPNPSATYQLKFRGCAEYGYGVCLDDVVVTGATAAPAPPVTITIGTGTTPTGNYPYNTYWHDNRTQIIYTAAEIDALGGAAGNITNYGFNISSAANKLMNGFTVRMAHTTLTNLSGGFQSPAWTTVYSTPMTITTTGWQNIALTTPFNWNGTDNLLIEICFDNTSYTSSSSVYATTTPEARVTSRYMDGGTGCALTSPTAYTARPNIRLTLPPKAGTLSGVVTNSYNGTPINTATITIQTNPYPVFSNGSFLINYFEGTFQVTASAPNFLPKTKTAVIVQNQTTTLNFALDPVPAVVSGIVTNAATGAPVVGAKVSFGTAFTYSIAGGAYSLNIYPGGTSGSLTASKPGFDNWTGTAFIPTPPNAYTQNIALQENVNPANNVVATLNAAQTAVDITWGLPVGQYMLIYDDGVAENFAIWATAGNKNAVKFTPIAYPATLLGGMVNIGKIDNYPAGSNPLVAFKMAVYDASGPGGTPGAELVAPFTVTPTALGFVEFTLATPQTITSGNFYLVMIQGGNAPNAAGIAVDTTTQLLRSYSQFGTGPWIPASGNFMMRARMSGSGGPLLAANAPGVNTVTAVAVPNLIYQTTPSTVTGTEGNAKVEFLGDSPESITGYQVYRLKQGEELTPAVWTSIGTPAATNITDASWPSLACGPYLWAVETIYTGNRVSSAAFSNVLGKCWTATVTVNIDLSCDSVTPANAKVVLQNLAFTDTVYVKYADATGVVVFDNVWKGNYKVTISKFNYTDLVFNPVVVLGDITINGVLLQIKTPPTGLSVDDRTLWATWNAPATATVLLNETFASGNFTANQWVVAGGTNWSVTTGFGNPQPSAQFYYSPAVTNYSQTLTSKSITGLNSPIMKLQYDIYLNNYGTTTLEQMAVELWDGATWHLLKNYDNSSGSDIPWTSEVVDVTAYSGITFKIRFRAYGEDSYNIDNWNVDNISVEARGPEGQDPCLIGYNFYLNNVLSAYLPPSDTSYRIPPSQVQYGTVYNACVLAIYGSGYSTTSCDVFTSHFLYPPTNIQALAIEDAAYITWNKPVISDSIFDNSDASAQVRTSFPNPGADYSPVVYNNPVTESPAAIWDVLFAWPVVPGSGAGAGQVGVETKNGFLYTSVWGGANAGPPWFSKYNMNGTLVEAFNITGATAVRDLACDGTYFYGAPASSSLYKMDFDAHTLVATINAGTAVRHIAFDPQADNGNGGFWCGDWATMRLIKMDGTLIASGPAMSNAYGSAYDNASTGGPFLWVFAQNGTPATTLEQYKINGNALAATGLTHLVGTSVPGVTTAALAGGLCTGVVNNKYAVIGIAQDAPNVVFALELSSNIPVGGGTPDGLIGYNIYRDGSFYHFVPDPDTLHYYDMNLDPDTYCYDVSAKYDLTDYGFPGQFDESLVAMNGPACVDINYGRPLPFFEPWDAGNFSFNGWSTVGGNWSVVTGFGNPAPAADFSWQPIVHNYTQSIETPILSAGAWTCAELWLDFDLKLIDRNSTGDEKLIVEVYTGGSWSTKAEFENTASMDWTGQHIDMKAYQGKAFKVRFTATGANSDDILHWYVDNVHVYGICKAPIDLTAAQNQFTTTLTWTAPECPQAGTLMTFIFDDGGWENGWRYNPGYLGWFGNYFPIAGSMSGVLKSFQVYYVDNGSGASMPMSIDVFDNGQTLVGSSATFDANVFDTWITVNVNDIPFSGPFYGMVKWDNLTGNSYYLADDEDGPNVSQNLGFQYDGTAFSNTSAPCVFLLRATAMVNGELKTIEFSSPRTAVPGPVSANANSINLSGDSGDHSLTSVVSASDSSTLIGYNVYRTDETGAGAFTKLNAAPQTALTYVDTYPSTLVAGTFKYYVTSLFEDSMTGAALCESPSDTVQIQFPAVGINEPGANSISIYPNPAKDFVNVSATARINSVEVLNFIGQNVYTNNNVNSTTMKLDVQNLTSGVYFVKVNTAAGSKTTKITVTR